MSVMKRLPFICREPISFSDLRTPIILEEPHKLYPVYGFEGVYEISMLGIIKKMSTGEFIAQYECKNGKAVCLTHPDSDYGTLCADLSDVWSSTFLEDNALNYYSYMDSINRRIKK